MNPLTRFPRLNNLWVDAKHRLAHRLARRRRRRASPDRDPRIGDPRGVLVVVIDCLRADRASGFGHDRETTPALDAFAEEAAAFPAATAPSPWTFPSVPSLLSGRYPRRHGARFEAGRRNLAAAQFPRKPSADVPTLPDLLSAAGYDTAMHAAIPMAEKAVGDRFDRVSVRYADADDRVDAALDWLDGRGRERWLSYVHLGDPHAPLDVPDRHRERFGVPDRDDLRGWRYREGAPATEAEGGDPAERAAFERYRDARLRAYDAAVRGADDAVGRLLAAIPDGTVVVVCGDHGEAFWEHPALERELADDPRGYYGADHGHSLFEETTRVPLWVRAPGVPAGRREGRVSLVDVAPTVLAALSVSAADRPATDGERLPNAAGADRPVYAEETAYGDNLVAVWRDGRKLIRAPDRGVERAFDLGADPAERDPLDPAATPPALREALDAFAGGVDGDDRMTVDEETADRLADLGYLE